MATAGICSTCGNETESQPYRCNSCNVIVAQKYRRQLRDDIFQWLGNECNECGFDDPRAFQIDHLNGGGRQHRKSMNDSPTVYLRYVLEHLDEFQLLCANCNQIKRIESELERGASPSQL